MRRWLFVAVGFIGAVLYKADNVVCRKVSCAFVVGLGNLGAFCR